MGQPWTKRALSKMTLPDKQVWMSNDSIDLAAATVRQSSRRQREADGRDLTLSSGKIIVLSLHTEHKAI